MRGMSLAKKRIKRIGFKLVFGQFLFKLFIVPVLRMIGLRRVRQIISHYQLDQTPIPSSKKVLIKSVNDDQCIRLLTDIGPDLVIVNGTRVISERVLKSVSATFINLHTGMTPKYRGVHGGYWAMAMNDRALCGVTVHLVDKGIDTGGVIYQNTIPVTLSDNFYTYPFIQFGVGIPLLVHAVDDVLHKRLQTRKSVTDESYLWYHPTIWKYLQIYFTTGIM